MLTPGTANLVAPQATTFSYPMVIKTGSNPWDLTNYGITMTVRPFFGSTTTTLLATVDNGKITVDPLLGKFTINFSALDTTIKAESYVFDIVFDSGSEITRILEGQFIVTAGVTV